MKKRFNDPNDSEHDAAVLCSFQITKHDYNFEVKADEIELNK